MLKRRGREVSVDPGWSTLETAEEHDPGETLVEDLRSHALREAMGELSEKHRELLVLLLADPPLSYDDISARLGIPRGSIGPTRARALAQLRSPRALRDWGDDVPVREGGALDVFLD
jgi:DNA-directed RNA polymerase specialized sigma24 family protein